MSSRISLLLLVLTALLTTGCASHSPLMLDKQQIVGLNSAEIQETPFFMQEDYQCGPASLAMVINYYGTEITPEGLAPDVFTPRAKGSFPAEMDAAVRQQGFISYPIDTLEALLREIEAGHPVIVLQNLGTSWYTMWHFAVVIGFEMESEQLILRSGDRQRLTTGFRLFDTTWRRSQRWGRVILPAGQVPQTATALKYLKAASDLEQTGPQGSAYAAYTAAVQRWPQQPMAHFALANFLLQDNQPSQAKRQFESMLKLKPDFAAGWNNYAYSLNALGCSTQAIAAAVCAQRLQPDNPAYGDTLAEMRIQATHHQIKPYAHAKSHAQAKQCEDIEICRF